MITTNETKLWLKCAQRGAVEKCDDVIVTMKEDRIVTQGHIKFS